MRRAPFVLVLAFVLLAACGPPESPDEAVVRSLGASEPVVASTEPEPPQEPPPSVCDPEEYRRLQAGTGHPENQHWHNHLGTSGHEPDYLRYHVACDPDGRHWSTDEYFCAARLLDGEHGNLPWDTDHRNGEGVNIPQAKPVSKIAGLDVRGQLEWFKDYVDARYGTPFRTPRPCRAGY